MVVHHLTYVSGRYRDGLRSDHWTDVRRCAEATFTAYSAGCTCGWAGPDWKADDWGYRRSLRDGRHHQADRESPSPEPGLLVAARIDPARIDPARIDPARIDPARVDVDGERAVG